MARIRAALLAGELRPGSGFTDGPYKPGELIADLQCRRLRRAIGNSILKGGRRSSRSGDRDFPLLFLADRPFLDTLTPGCKARLRSSSPGGPFLSLCRERGFDHGLDDTARQSHFFQQLDLFTGKVLVSSVL